MRDYYRLLRAKLKENGIEHYYLAEKLGISNSTMSLRFNPRRAVAQNTDWPLRDMYMVMDMINEPYSKMHIYFPREGMYTPEKDVMDIQDQQTQAAIDVVKGIAKFLELSQEVEKAQGEAEKILRKMAKNYA